MKITASLVLFCNPPDQFEPAIRSVMESSAEVTLSIFDNSPEPLASAFFAHPRVRYHHAGANLGFGTAHNRAFAAVADRSDIHFIVNPDVAFGPTVMPMLAEVFALHRNVVAVMPTIRDEQGCVQPLCKALPTPMHLVARRFVPFASLRRAIDRSYEFRDLPDQGLVDIPNLSGCFLGFRAETFACVGGFDERFFMYMEDIDLVRRLGDHGRTVFVPAATVCHGHTRGSYRLGRLLLVHVLSALAYFHKWGWFRDPIRSTRNAAARKGLAQFSPQ